jgi:hypothetical protein
VDPNLTGYPAEDLNRIPTRGNISNTIAIFPKAWWRPISGLELYGGVLLALAETDYTDPLNTRLAGGQAKNPLNGNPGGIYGLEFDIGLRFRGLINGTRLTFGIEAGTFLPMSAFVNANNESMPPVFGGRATVAYEL